MKRSSQILGLPVLSIDEGKQIGKVRHLVLNPQRGTVDYILIEEDAWYLELKTLPFEEVKGIGEFALAVMSSPALSAVTKNDKTIALLGKNLCLSGMKIISNKGRFVGTVGEYYINEDTGEIEGLQLFLPNHNKPAGIIPKNFILTYGNDFLIVKEGSEDKLVSQMEEEEPLEADGWNKEGFTLETPEATRETAATAPFDAALLSDKQGAATKPDETPEEDEAAETTGRTVFTEYDMPLVFGGHASPAEPETPFEFDLNAVLAEAEAQFEPDVPEEANSPDTPVAPDLLAELDGLDKLTDNTPPEAVKAEPAAPAAPKAEKRPGETIKHFEEQQKRFLLGKKLAMRILADDGQVVAEEGAIIDEEIIERAKAANKYIQLTLNIR